MKRKDDDFGIDLPPFSPFELVLAEARYIILYDEICSESAREVNTKLIAMAIKSRKPITLEINSPGGEVAAGISIMNTLQSLPCPVVTIINGEACSMAGFISVVADKRLITPNSYWMGHALQDGVGGTPQTIKDRAVYLEKLEEDLKAVFEKKTKLNDDEFQKMLRGELWLNPKECLEKAIEGETYEFTIMYPGMVAGAQQEGNEAAAKEASEQIQESKEHAAEFAAVLAKAEKRFAALQKVEKRHAEAYQQVLESL